MTPLIALTTLPPDADGLEEALVREGLVACAQTLGPITSRYVWQGQVETSSERLVLLKTSVECRPALEARLSQLHPYQVPELIFWEPSAVAPAYLAWWADVLK